MAVVLVGLTPTFTRVPFIKPGDMQRMQTAIPRAIITLVVNAGVVDAKPINDQLTLQVSTVLPRQFAYRLIESEISVHGGGTGTYNDGGEWQVNNGLRGQPLGVTTRTSMFSLFDGLSFAPIVAQKFWKIERNPSYIIQSIAAGVSPVVDWRVMNNGAAATVAATCNFLATFYEYDIEQVQMFPPLIPTLVYSV